MAYKGIKILCNSKMLILNDYSRYLFYIISKIIKLPEAPNATATKDTFEISFIRLKCYWQRKKNYGMMFINV